MSSNDSPPDDVEFIKKGVTAIPQHAITIYRTACSYVAEKSQIQGECIFTHNSFVFIPKSKKAWMMEIPWQNIATMVQMQKKTEKGLQLVLGNQKTITLLQIKDRDMFWAYVLLLTKQAPSYGLTTKDDTEVVRKLNVFRAPYAFEETIQANFNDVMKMMKSADLWNEALTIGGCNSVIISSWKKTKDGISRLVQYTQPLFQSASVSATQTLMKSGETGALELFLCLSRPSLQGFLHVPVQLYFKKEGENISYRCAYSLDWIHETWDKEFVEAAVGRLVRMNYHYIKSKILNQNFNESEFEGEWRKHQGFVLVLISLIIGIICVVFSPDDMNWYQVMAGFIAFVFFFVL